MQADWGMVQIDSKYNSLENASDWKPLKEQEIISGKFQ